MTINQLLKSQLEGKVVLIKRSPQMWGPAKVEKLELDTDGSLVIWGGGFFTRFPSLVGLEFDLDTNQVKPLSSKEPAPNESPNTRSRTTRVLPS
jgi:hypothetical protein